MYLSVYFSTVMDSPPVMLKDAGIESSIPVTKRINISAWFWSMLLLSKVYSWINVFVGPGIITDLSDVGLGFMFRTRLRLKAGDCTILIDQSLPFLFYQSLPVEFVGVRLGLGQCMLCNIMVNESAIACS